MSARRSRVIVTAMGLLAAAVTVGAPTAGADAAVARAGASPQNSVVIGEPLGQPPNALGGCELAVLPGFPAPPSCTLYSAFLQPPTGEWTLRQASVRTGPRTGPMRFVVVRAFRSQLPGPDGLPSGIICCFSAAQSQVFVPAPNQVNTIDVNLPMTATVTFIDGEPVEIVDRLAISILDLNSSLPLIASNQAPLISAFLPAMPPNDQPALPSTFPTPAFPTINGRICPAAQVASGAAFIEMQCSTLPGGPGEPAAPDEPGGPGSSGSSFTGLTPARLLDTRATGSVAAGTVTEIPIAGRPGIGPDADSVVLNVTVVDPLDPGFATVYPCGGDPPNASNLNFVAGQTVPNAVVSKVGANGAVCVVASAATNLLVDVNGALSTGFTGLEPARLLDNRTSGGVAAGSVTRVPVAGRHGVPTGADAVVLNVTVVDPAEAGFATVFPCGGEAPDASNLNFVAGQTVPNAVVSKVGDDGDVCVYSSVATSVLVDVNGALESGFSGLTPERLLDTRATGRVSTGSVTAVEVAGVGSVPAGAEAVVLNVTAVGPLEAGFVTVYACGGDPPDASNLNFVAGQTVPNAVVAEVGTGGSICLFSSAPVDLLVDVNGAFT